MEVMLTLYGKYVLHVVRKAVERTSFLYLHIEYNSSVTTIPYEKTL